MTRLLQIGTAVLLGIWQAGSAQTCEADDAFDGPSAAPLSDHWSFQPLRAVQPPPLESAWARNAVDRFVYRRLGLAGLAPAAEANRLALVRRVYFDVIGLPPTPEEVDAFLGDASPRAYEELVDRLLASPHYGENWARHWLDLVRYAESDGYKADAYRPHAWRYRDYVIRSFNNDKPYDRFVLEQLAGDELPDRDADALIATAYLRHWIYEYNQRDLRGQWTYILNEMTDVTADVFLGLGMGCARCHDHKFDPIPQRDYFRLQAFLAATLPQDEAIVAPPEEVAQYSRQLARWEAATAEIRAEIREIESPLYQKLWRQQVEKFPPDTRPELRQSAADRSPLGRQVAYLAERRTRDEWAKEDVEKRLRGKVKERWQELYAKLAEFEALRPEPLPVADVVCDVGATAPPTRIPGEPDANEIAPGFLSVLNPEPPRFVGGASNSTGRRSALARWLTKPDHPLTTRVIVNRIWQHHFGEGLVRTPSDLGHLGEEPSHPELLDWLARYFVREGWSLKQLHRLILTSATYRQTAHPPASEIARRLDPQNRLLWRANMHRLSAEQVRDAMLAASGELRHRHGGGSLAGSQPCRAIYLKVIRNRPEPLLRAFDAPDRFSSSCERNVTTTPTQALMMINGPWTLARAEALAQRVLSAEGQQTAARVATVYRRAYGRLPEAEEVEKAVAFLHRDDDRAGEEDVTSSTAHRHAWVDFCHVILNSNEFLYVD